MQTAVRHSNNLLEVLELQKRPRLRFELCDENMQVLDVEATATATSVESAASSGPDADAAPTAPQEAPAQCVASGDAQEGRFSWHLGGALLVPGLKHICSNVQGDVLSRLQHFKEFQDIAQTCSRHSGFAPSTSGSTSWSEQPFLTLGLL